MDSPTGDSGYHIEEQLYESLSSRVYRARRKSDGAAVILKLPGSDLPTPKQAARLRHEAEILQRVTLPGVAHCYALETRLTGPVLVLEDIGGVALGQILGAGPLPLTTVLSIATQVATALGVLHEAGIIHKDLNPANLVINFATGRVQIIDFGIASWLPREVQAVQNPALMEGTLAYLAPEQTGRMNRAVDSRADLYALGATLYELLCGQAMFKTADPMEMVYCHIARTPLPPHKLSDRVPEGVSALVMKLLQKTPELRYHSATGLLHDLQTCQNELARSGTVPVFALGTRDIARRLQLSQKLYGRAAEQGAVLAAYERVCAGEAELLLISGYSGVGKTALVSEIHKSLARGRGYFVSGKFDQLQRSVPYESVARALRELCRQILTQPEAALRRWAERCQQALAGSGKLLVDLIPELPLITGPQPDVPTLGPAEQQNRFHLVFQDFVRVFTAAEHPLVLFLDDLQWADPASLQLLHGLLTDPARGHLLIIGAYRDNEVSGGHPLLRMLATLQKHGGQLTQIALHPLGVAEVTQLIADTVGSATDVVAALARTVFDKTQGNPFFIGQFLNMLHAEGLLRPDAVAGTWTWDLEAIVARQVTDNVVEFMAAKLQRLAMTTQRLLQRAACIGYQFSLRMLASLVELSLPATSTQLREALSEGLIQPLTADYRLLHPAADSGAPPLAEADWDVWFKFQHDRVQQAAYSLLEKNAQQRIHLQIGRQLRSMAALHQGEPGQLLFDMVNHLNRGAGLITQQDERLALARLNLDAGQRAKSAAAYQAATTYVQAGLTLLPVEAWAKEYELTYALHREAASCAYLSSDFTAAEELFGVSLAQARSRLDRVQIHNLRILLYAMQGKFADALQVGHTALALLEVVLPTGDAELRAAAATELEALQRVLQSRHPDELLAAPRLDNAEQEAALQVLVNMTTPAYINAPLQLALITVIQVGYSLRFGHSNVSAYGYAVYGLFLANSLGHYEEAYQLSQLALRLNDRFANAELGSRLCYVHGALIAPYRRSLRSALLDLERATQLGLHSGDFENASYGCWTYSLFRFLLGDDLESVRSEIDRALALLQRTQNLLSTATVTLLRQVVQNLRGETRDRTSLDDSHFDEAQFVQAHDKLAYVQRFYYIIKLMLRFLHGDLAGALQLADEAERLHGVASGSVALTELLFYKCLTLTALYPAASAQAREQSDAALPRYQSKLSALATACPDNFAAKQLVVAAEVARVHEQPLLAMELYDQAIAAAQQYALPHQAALASELAGRFYLGLGRTKVAASYFNDAYHGYLRWGATAKARALADEQRALLQPPGGAPLRSGTISTSREDTAGLDLLSVTKAAQTISREIHLEPLLAQLTKILLENAGAERGFILLYKGEQLVIEAYGTAGATQIEVLQSLPVTGSAELCETIVHLVARTGEAVVLDHAAQDSRYGRDPYIAARQVKSLLCVPSLNHGKLVGIVYLENNLSAATFTTDRIEVLRILSTQIAISLENASLYQHLEDKVRERTDELRRTQTRLLQLEKESVERQMAGGFAHEMRNALAGPNALLTVALGRGGPIPGDSIPLANARLLQKIYDLSQSLAQSQDHSLTPATSARIQELVWTIYDNEEQLEEMLQVIGKSVTRGLAITQQILEYARMGQQDVARERIALNRLIEDLRQEVRHGLDKQGVQLQLHLDPALHHVYGHELPLQLLLKNLLLNARDAVIDVRMAADREGLITFTTTQRADFVELVIADTGIGIEPANLPRIFEPFFSTKPDTGTGLGLALVKKIVTLMQGEIAVASTVGVGTRLTLRFPAAPSEV